MRYRRTLIAPDRPSWLISKKSESHHAAAMHSRGPVRVLPGGDLLAGWGSIEGSGGVICQEERDQAQPAMLMLARVRGFWSTFFTSTVFPAVFHRHNSCIEGSPGGWVDIIPDTSCPG